MCAAERIVKTDRKLFLRQYHFIFQSTISTSSPSRSRVFKNQKNLFQNHPLNLFTYLLFWQGILFSGLKKQ